MASGGTTTSWKSCGSEPSGLLDPLTFRLLTVVKLRESFIADDASTPIIGFSSNGQYLVIYDPDAVPIALTESQICKHKDYQSFQRQMTVRKRAMCESVEANPHCVDSIPILDIRMAKDLAERAQ